MNSTRGEQMIVQPQRDLDMQGGEELSTVTEFCLKPHAVFGFPAQDVVRVF